MAPSSEVGWGHNEDLIFIGIKENEYFINVLLKNLLERKDQIWVNVSVGSVDSCLLKSCGEGGGHNKGLDY